MRRSRFLTLAGRVALGVILLGSEGCAGRRTLGRPWPASPTPPSERMAPSAPRPEAPWDPSNEVPPGVEPYEVGIASWYGNALKGRKTSNGERFDPGLFTAAHKRLPFGTWVEVRRRDTGRTVCVRINDRGPNGRAAHRIIDLSERAAAALGMLHRGIAEVALRIVSGPDACRVR